MFGPDNRFTTDDRRLLRAIARGFVQIGHKLDLNLEVALEDLALEKISMTTQAELLAQSEAMIAKMTANTDATAAIAVGFNGLKAQVADLQQQLADAIANGADSATLTAISNNLKAAADGIDADTLAEAALVNTPAEPTP